MKTKGEEMREILFNISIIQFWKKINNLNISIYKLNKILWIVSASERPNKG
jgi:hypothetical protein